MQYSSVFIFFKSVCAGADLFEVVTGVFRTVQLVIFRHLDVLFRLFKVLRDAFSISICVRKHDDRLGHFTLVEGNFKPCHRFGEVLFYTKDEDGKVRREKQAFR